MNTDSLSNELGPHDHEEGVENVQGGLVLHGDQTTVKPASKLNNVGCLPGSIEFFCGTLEPLAFR